MLCHRQHHLIPPGNNMISVIRIYPVAAVSIQRRAGRAIPVGRTSRWQPTTVLDVSQNPVTNSGISTTSPSNWWVMVRFLNHQQYQSPPCWVGYFLATWKTWSWNLSLGETPSLTPFRMPGHRSENKKLSQYEATGNLPNMRKTCLVMSSWTRSVWVFCWLCDTPQTYRNPGCWVRAALDEHGCKAKSCDNKTPHLWHDTWNADCYRSLVSRTMIYIRIG